MSGALFLPLPGNETLASRLAELRGGTLGRMQQGTFPDGETHLRLDFDPAGKEVALVCTLAQPDQKLLPLLFAADAARDLGARKVGLIAPYLCYMRQDKRFHPGEAVTSRSFARLLSQNLDWLVTVDPHLHRYAALADIYSIPTRTLHAGALLAGWIGANVAKPFLIGPDAESRQWVAETAALCGAEFAVLSKERLGDAKVRIAPPPWRVPHECTPVFLDDIISTGASLLEGMGQVVSSKKPVALAVHGILSENTANRLEGISAHLVTTNSVDNPHAEIDLTGLIDGNLAGLA